MHLYSSAFWHLKLTQLLHLNKQIHATHVQIFALPSCNLIRASDPPAKQRREPGVSPCSSLLLCNPCTFPLWTLLAERVSAFYCVDKKVGSQWSLRGTGWRRQGKPGWCNMVCQWRSAVHSCLDKRTRARANANAHTRAHSHLRVVRGCGRCAAALQWAFRHFLSVRRPTHSFPPSRYLRRDIIHKGCKSMGDYRFRGLKKNKKHWGTTTSNCLEPTKYYNGTVMWASPRQWFTSALAAQACGGKLISLMHTLSGATVAGAGPEPHKLQLLHSQSANTRVC